MRSIPANSISSLSLSKRLKTMRLARFIGEDNKGCYSRHIGSVIVDESNFVKSTGYNAPPKGTPHTDDYTYLKEYLWPRLNEEEKNKLSSLVLNRQNSLKDECEIVCGALHGGKQCPRQLLGYKSGEATGHCSCVHSEENAILTARQSVKGCFLFGFCPVSCIGCTKSIVQAEITEVHFLNSIYDKSSLVLYKFANIPIFLYSEDELNESLC